MTQQPAYYPAAPDSPEPQHHAADIVVYGGTSGGITAAVAAARQKRKAVLLVFNDKLGGMTAGGLGRTDVGNQAAFGGISREFFHRVGNHYGEEISWVFEPHVAEMTYRQLLSEAGVTVLFFQRLASVEVVENGIRSLTTEAGHTFSAPHFIDASYEGDLMAAAGVSFAIGREPAEQYREIYAGRHFGHPNHNFQTFVDPYRSPGDPASGLLPEIQHAEPGRQGEGDHCIQAYNFRLCLTQQPDRIPFPKPDQYDPRRYELLARYIRSGVYDPLNLSAWMPNHKTDTNNFGAFSTDYIGGNYDWPEGSYSRREEIYQDHVNYMQGLLYFLCHDERVPEDIRAETAQWGLPNDEFTSTGGWPHELYVREARRMVSDYVMTEADCIGQRAAEDPVALAAYQIDSHNCRRLVLFGRAFNEGNVEIKVPKPFPVSYRALVPRKSEIRNLLVPWALSASHTAFGSIRMEPVFMVLGQASAIAAQLAHDLGCAVQDVPYPRLRAALLDQDIRLEWPVPGDTEPNKGVLKQFWTSAIRPALQPPRS